jgi:hypothetical protein
LYSLAPLLFLGPFGSRYVFRTNWLIVADQAIGAVSKFLDDRGLVGVIKFFQIRPAPDRAGWTRINFLKYKLSDNLLYVNSSLVRPIVKQKGRKLKEKDWLD